MERRPLKSRQTKWANTIAEGVARTGVTPNAISVLGMVAGILAGVAFFVTGRVESIRWPWWLAGAALVQLRLVANLLDGMVAQIQGSSSPVGELFNEVPDRVSDAAILIGFGYAAGSNAVLGWSAAVLAVFVAYVRAQNAAAGAAQDFGGPMAKPQRMAKVTVAAVITAILGEQIFGAVDFPEVALVLIVAGAVVTAIRRLRRGAAELNRRNDGG